MENSEIHSIADNNGNSKLDHHVSNRVSGIERHLAIMDYRLGNNEKLLTEINEAIKQLVIINQEQKAIRDDVHELRIELGNKKSELDKIKMKVENSSGAIVGAVTVISIFLTVAGYLADNSLTDIKNLHDKVGGLETQIEIMKSK